MLKKRLFLGDAGNIVCLLFVAVLILFIVFLIFKIRHFDDCSHPHHQETTECHPRVPHCCKGISRYGIFLFMVIVKVRSVHLFNNENYRGLSKTLWPSLRQTFTTLPGSE